MDLEQLEAFALGDRDAALAQMVPGTEDHDYHRALLLQERGKFREVDALLADWRTRHGETERWSRIDRRQTLHKLGALDKKAIEKVRDELGVELDHQADLDSERPRNPSRLDESAIDPVALVDNARRRDSDLRGVTAVGLALLLDAELDANRRRALLDKLAWTPSKRLVELIAADLGEKSSRGFGTLRVHALLTRAQLDALAALRPELRTNPAWVDAQLRRLRPPAHVDWQGDPAARAAYLEALVAFVAQLPAAFNSLRAFVLAHRLDLDRRQGRYDRDRFVEYLKVPRHAHYVRSKWLSNQQREHVAQLGTDFTASTGLGALPDEEGLVRDYLHRYLVREDGKAFAEWLDADWLDRELAVARLLAGDAEMERWTTVLGAAAAAHLRDRVDLDLALDNPVRLAADAPVAINVDVKNVAQLAVKVFRIDELAFFLSHGREVTTDLDLDGLTGGFETSLAFDAPAMHRVRRRIELPACARPGTFVVELIGNGKSSRALVRKGRLRYATRHGAAGVVVTLAGETGQLVPGAAIWLGGREYRAEADGTVTLPFSTRPGRTPMLLVGGGVAMREEVTLLAEEYRLAADIAVEREALAAGGTARAIVRVQLTAAHAPASVALLGEARAEIATTDVQGTASSREQPIALVDDADVVLEWAMPPNVASVAITIRGKVRSLSAQKDVELEAGTAIDVASIHRTSELEALYLASTPAGWVVTVAGKTGEARPRRQVNVTLKHAAVTDDIVAVLDTDERGRVELGALAGVYQLTAATATTTMTWPLADAAAIRGTHRVVEGQPVAVPLPRHLTGDAALARATLVETRDGHPLRDAATHLRAEPAALVAVGLAPGDYVLAIGGVPGVALVSVVPASAPIVGGWAALPAAMAELSPRRARVGACELAGDHLAVEVRDAGPQTRVHVVATRFAPAPAGRPFAHHARPAEHRGDPAVESRYLSGRDLGDEYRYVLERRTAKRRPGLLLERPGLLLNPWAVRATSTEIATATVGGMYAQAAPRMAAPARGAAGGGGPGGVADNAAFPTHDFVPRAQVVVANLRPDASGRVTVDRAALAGMGVVVVYVVEPGLITSRALALPEVEEPVKDLRLRAGLDPERHVIERKDIIGLAAGDALVVDDLATARAEVVDTVGKAHRYLLSLAGDATLRELGFLTAWHALADADKRTKYSKYACHELHLFLYWKDRPFFDAVIRPYLANKQPRTFVDKWLLGEDVSAYAQPWRLGRLNVFERCLLLGTLSGPVADAVRRLVGDAVDLVAPDPERDGALVDALLGASALSTEGGELANALADARPKGEVLADEKMMLREEAAEMLDMDMESERSDRRRAEPAKKMKAMKPMAAGFAAPGAPPPPPAPSAAPAFAAEIAYDLPSEGAKSDDLRRRDQVAQHYRGADLTQEWAEHNWWHTRPAEPGPEHVAANRFWRDFAAHRAGGAHGPFLSPHLGLCTGGFAEMMCALAVLDLPFVAGAHAITTADGRMTLRAASHTLVARRQLAEVAPLPDAPPILIGQNLVRADDRYDWDGAEQREKYVSGELLVGVVYTGLVAVTNPTSSPVRVDLLVQIPRGAMPVDSGVATRTVHLSLDAYGTETHEYSFYFPRAGRFVHYPAHVARKGELLAWADAASYDVVVEPSAIDATSWRNLAQRGSLDQVVAFLATANLGRLELDRVAWRMKDRGWFDKVTAALAARGVVDPTLWAYALRHRDAVRLREWLEHQDEWLKVAGRFDAGPVAVDEAERGWHEHLEYAPLVNARAHRLGARERILNDGLAQEYRDALEWMALRPATDRDRARAAHYLFTQDRLDAALALVERVDPAAAGSQLQLDYLRAYAACARGDLAAARTLATPHAEHPVDRWRHRFAALLAMLREAQAGGAATQVDPDSRDQQMADLAARQATFELAADRSGVIIDHRNLPELELRFHQMELELLFSRQPFVQSDTTRFSFIDPSRVLRIALEPSGRTTVKWPVELTKGSVVVEAVAAGVRKAVAHYMHDLLVTVAHQYGQLRVLRASDQAILPATYVKVFARQPDNTVAFYKDGYTDLCGRFDYATLSTDDLTRVNRFAILVASDADGAVVVEAAPPQR
jgi:hypothetical protein